MGLFGKGNVMNMVHYDGLPGFQNGYATAMELDEENRCLVFRARAFKNVSEVKLPLNKVTNAGNVNITEIEQQSKIGRAFIGGFLFGAAGAIVGALSAGEKKKLKTVYIINYVSEGETKVIVMQSNGNPNYFKFQEKLKQYLPKQETPEEIVLGDDTPEKLTPDGELPWGWIGRNHEFINDVEIKYRHFLNEWVSAEYNTKEKYAALKSFLIFLHEAKSICQMKGECFEKWFSIIADDSYIEKREHELAELEKMFR